MRSNAQRKYDRGALVCQFQCIERNSKMWKLEPIPSARTPTDGQSHLLLISRRTAVGTGRIVFAEAKKLNSTFSNLSRDSCRRRRSALPSPRCCVNFLHLRFNYEWANRFELVQSDVRTRSLLKLPFSLPRRKKETKNQMKLVVFTFSRLIHSLKHQQSSRTARYLLAAATHRFFSPFNSNLTNFSDSFK